jgi:hypothetical protein
MAENTGIDTFHDDDLGDEAFDRSSGGKFCPNVGSLISRSVG